jgi:hydroxymethylglutaryl-CoA lyase
MPESLPSSIRITEVGPRDGLQNEGPIVPVEEKVAFTNLLSTAGVAEIEVTSFVSPKWVPQLADADEVLGRIERQEGVMYSALVPNEAGLERALAARVDKIAVFTAASESFSRKNTNAGITEAIERFRPVVAQAHVAKVAVRGYISTVVACPYEGPISPRQVHDVVLRLLELGVDEIDLGETIGVAVPADIDRLYEGLADILAPQQTTLHLHDTRGTALACAYRAMQLGVTSFDSSCGGLGGCPYAPGAAGNLATEDLVYLAQRCGVTTGVQLDSLFAAARHIAAALGRRPPGRVFNVDGLAGSQAN